jgi:hypothetical protein
MRRSPYADLTIAAAPPIIAATMAIKFERRSLTGSTPAKREATPSIGVDDISPKIRINHPRASVNGTLNLPLFIRGHAVARSFRLARLFEELIERFQGSVSVRVSGFLAPKP